MEWQPIETAPKDETDVLVWSALGYCVIAQFRDGYWWGRQLDELVEPTHWMPLPPPPGDETREAEGNMAGSVRNPEQYEIDARLRAAWVAVQDAALVIAEARTVISGLRRQLAEADERCENRVVAGWAPIDTAPKDGTRILAWWVGTIPVIVHWFGPADLPGLRPGGWYESAGFPGSPRRYPTHWMPLPEGPTHD